MLQTRVALIQIFFEENTAKLHNYTFLKILQQFKKL